MPANPLVIDSNLLVLLVVGRASPKFIAMHKKLKQYTVADFDLLLRIVRPAPEVLVTPNTLAEASNLLGYIDEPARSRVYEIFKALIPTMVEQHIPSATAAGRAEFVRLGLTDSVLLEVTRPTTTLLTADLQLYLTASRAGKNAVNFNHVRVQEGILS